MPSQAQIFHHAHRHVHDTLQDAAFLCGLVGNNPSPLTATEIAAAADSGQPYAWAFTLIHGGRDALAVNS